MAVFPDRIILKHSTDSQASIESQISSTGASRILPGEIVIGRENGAVKLYAIDSTGAVRVVGSINLAATSINALGDVDTATVAPTNGQSLVWNGTNWVPNRPVSVINDLTDVDTGTSPPTVGQSLVWNGTNWTPNTPVASFNDLTDVDTATNPPVYNQAIVWNGTTWVPQTIITDLSTGRGDGGDFDLTTSLASFIFGIYGGGDFDTTTNDLPVEYFDTSIIDAGEIT